MPTNKPFKLVKSDKYAEHVPASLISHIDKPQWGGLGLDLYNFSRNNEGIATPGVPDYIIGTMLSGEIDAENQIDGSPWAKKRLHTGAITLLDKGTSVNWRWRNKDVSEVTPQNICLFLDKSLVYQIAMQTLEIEPINIELRSEAIVYDPLIFQITKSLQSEAKSNSAFGKLFGQTAAQLLAIHLLKNYATITPKIIEQKCGLSKRHLNQVKDYINDHLDQDISLDSLAILTGLSSYHFARMFKRSTGLAPHQYVMKCRIQKAKELLSFTYYPVLQIAIEVGYTNQAHFSKIFKKCTGYTPSQYRSNN